MHKNPQILPKHLHKVQKLTNFQLTHSSVLLSKVPLINYSVSPENMTTTRYKEKIRSIPHKFNFTTARSIGRKRQKDIPKTAIKLINQKKLTIGC